MKLLFFSEYVCELVFGVYAFDVDLWVVIDPVKLTNQDVGSGNMSHRWTSTFNDQLDFRFIIHENVKTWHLHEKISRLRKYGPY